jgi:hypothetical protein
MRIAALMMVMAAPVTAAACPAEFNFWVGEWDVQVAGKVVAHSSIESLQSGCLIVENWLPFAGGAGKSWNYFDSANRKWEQLWITDTGEILRVSGGWKDGAMREANATHRHSFTPIPPNRVRQFCEESNDGGKTWQVTFDAIYIRR